MTEARLGRRVRSARTTLAHRIVRDAHVTDRDGSEAALFHDLRALPKGHQKWLITELERLPDEAILSRCQRIEHWPPAAEGTWVLLGISPYVLVCQLQLENVELFRFGAGRGMLKVVRVAHENFAPELLRLHAHDDEDDED